VDLNNLRFELRQQRKQLTAEFCKQTAEKITNKIIQCNFFPTSQNIACYLPSENEVDTWPLIKIILAQKKNCYLPVLAAKNTNELSFVQFTTNTELKPNKYGILEPLVTSQNTIAAQQLDLAILPLVAFNEKFYRMGRGAGYYDRTFAYKLADPKIPPYLIGVAYAFQLAEFQPHAWDVPMDLVIMEQD
jgi:5-formyltetrahydrofolate cyclo-ligase